ncbi:Ureidoglycolate lyase [Pichia californica]|uniref:Ureidoglycolate lyase n=1 Tax=Pichia californica TaxID=460514 RepID=A0A9P7BHZ9_9ASCO|nr:Ureidoglycolate lyase [[Candida] californica]KAG0691250.1 Ureidoglycolate lyase [[Candida] californica]
MVKILDVDTSAFTKIIDAKRSYDGYEKYGVAMNVDHLKESVSIDEANQGSAIKLVKVAPCINKYSDAPSGHPATTNWNIFRSSVIAEKWTKDNEGNDIYNLSVLEKHPYSTQTFVPMGRSQEEDAYVVNVAPDKNGQPDYENVESYVFKGNTAVTYNLNTWHSPMVVLGKTTDFCVVTNENDVPKENCVEVFYNPGMNIRVTKV